MQHSITNHSHHAVYYLPMTYLFYNWNFVPFDPIDPFHHPPAPASGNHQSVLLLFLKLVE